MGTTIFPTSGIWPNAAVGTGDDQLATYGARLKAARKAARMSQAQVGSLAGVHQSQISDLENDEYAGSVATAQIAAALNVEALWLATGKGARKSRPAALDAELLEDVIVGVEMGLKGRTETPERKAKMIAALYQMHLRSETKPEPGEILEFLRSIR